MIFEFLTISGAVFLVGGILYAIYGTFKNTSDFATIVFVIVGTILLSSSLFFHGYEMDIKNEQSYISNKPYYDSLDCDQLQSIISFSDNATNVSEAKRNAQRCLP